MLECINKECVDNKNGKCENKLVLNNSDCLDRIKPTHTPTYAKEQLNHAIEKENKCDYLECERNVSNECKMPEHTCLRIKEPINYEEEYHKLKKENEELKERNENYKARLDNQSKRIKTDGNQIQKLFVEIDSLKLKAAVTEKLEIEINNLNAIIDSKDDEIGEMNNCIVSLNAKVEELLNISIENDREIAELKEGIKKGIESVKEARVALENKNKHIEQLEIDNETLRIENNQFKKEMEENNEMIEIEYQNKLFIAEQKIKEVQEVSNAFEKMVDILRAKGKEKDKTIELSKIENTKLREAIKKIVEVL